MVQIPMQWVALFREAKRTIALSIVPCTLKGKAFNREKELDI
jgi:hypothetical protein